MSVTQTQLQFRAIGTTADNADQSRLVAWLAENPGWHSAAQIAQEIGYTDRRVRSLAASTRGLIISGPGTPGYCHLSHATAEQLAHAAETLASQGRAMIRRAIAMRRRAHALISHTTTQP